ncbi:hypothetical protein RUND412_007629 [Rhizina undulata]
MEQEATELHCDYAHFNFIKIYMINHFEESIREYGNIPMYSTETGERAHKTHVKKPYRQTNKVDVTAQILEHERHEQVLAMHELNLRQIALEGFCSAELQEALHLFPPEYKRKVNSSNQHNQHNQYHDILVFPPPHFGSSQICERQIGSKIATTVVHKIHIPNTKFPLAHYLQTYFQKEYHANSLTLEQIAEWKVSEYFLIRVPVNLFQEEDDWSIQILHYPVFKQIYTLAVVEPLSPVNSGQPHEHHGLVRVCKPRLQPSQEDLWVINVECIGGIVHLIPMIPGEEGVGAQWLVNSYIDLETYTSTE